MESQNTMIQSQHTVPTAAYEHESKLHFLSDVIEEVTNFKNCSPPTATLLHHRDDRPDSEMYPSTSITATKILQDERSVSKQNHTPAATAIAILKSKNDDITVVPMPSDEKPRPLQTQYAGLLLLSAPAVTSDGSGSKSSSSRSSSGCSSEITPKRDVTSKDCDATRPSPVNHNKTGASADSNTTAASQSLAAMTVLPIEFEPGPFDVICGRGRACKDAPGNKAYRDVIMSQLQLYAKSYTKLEKGQIISDIMQQVKQQCHQYHAKSNNATTSQTDQITLGGFIKYSNGRWYDVGDFLAREKTSQCFRDALSLQYSSSAQSKYLRRRANHNRAEANVTDTCSSQNDIHDYRNSSNDDNSNHDRRSSISHDTHSYQERAQKRDSHNATNTRNSSIDGKMEPTIDSKQVR
jgi:hypothetical protein